MAGPALPATALRPLLGAAALTVGLHLAALGGWPGGGLRGTARQAAPGSAQAVQARWLTLPAAATPAATAAANTRQVGQLEAPATRPSKAASATSAVLDGPAADPAPRKATASVAGFTPSSEGAPPALAPAAPGEAGDEEYLPRHRLTQVPQTDAVLIPYPEQAPAGHWALRLTVFIDETGQVRRVRTGGAADEAELPPELLDAAVQAFMATRYTPGELQGQAVKSRLEIAVEFRADEPPRSADGS